MLTLLVGGARSGKSALAVDIGRRHDGPVTFIATSPLDVDADLVGRIEHHRAERPDWPTIEEPIDLAGSLGRAGGSMVIVDCLTLWVSNMMWQGRSDIDIADDATLAAGIASRREAPTVVVTNEVGFGVHPDTALGRRYRDLLGRVNQVWAAAATTTLLLVAGRAVKLHDPWSFL